MLTENAQGNYVKKVIGLLLSIEKECEFDFESIDEFTLISTFSDAREKTAFDLQVQHKTIPKLRLFLSYAKIDDIYNNLMAFIEVMESEK